MWLTSKEKFLPGLWFEPRTPVLHAGVLPVICMGGESGRALICRAGDPGLNPGWGGNVSHKVNRQNYNISLKVLSYLLGEYLIEQRLYYKFWHNFGKFFDH